MLALVAAKENHAPPLVRKSVVTNAARYLEVLRAWDVAQVGLCHGDHLAHTTVQNGAGCGLGEAHELLDGQRWWQGQGVGVSNYVDKSRAVVGQRLLDLLRSFLRILDAEVLDAGSLCDLGKVDGLVVGLVLRQTCLLYTSDAADDLLTV